MPESDGRRCLVIETCVPDTIRQPGEIIIWKRTGDLPRYLRLLSAPEVQELVDSEAIEKALMEKEMAGSDEGSPKNLELKRRKSELFEAVRDIEHANDAHWTNSGQPLLAYVNNNLVAAGALITTRPELRMVFPGLVRQADRIIEQDGKDIFGN